MSIEPSKYASKKLKENPPYYWGLRVGETFFTTERNALSAQRFAQRKGLHFSRKKVVSVPNLYEAYEVTRIR